MLRSATEDDVDDDVADEDDEYCEERVAEENRLLEELRNFIPDHQRCFAHTLELVIKEGIKSSP